jgi:hypothetical protein
MSAVTVIVMMATAAATASGGHFEVVEMAVKVSFGEHGFTRKGIEHGDNDISFDRIVQYGSDDIVKRGH